MPLQVLLTVFDSPEQTVEFPDDATVFTVKEWVRDQTGVDSTRVMTVQGGRVLKNGDLLSSDRRYLKLKAVARGDCGMGSHS
jgi:hypothetical protein